MTDCGTCGRPIQPDDGVVTRRGARHPEATVVEAPDLDPFAEDLAASWRHVACTEEGVRRWCRADRPGEGPLEWVRDAGLSWTGLRGVERGALIL